MAAATANILSVGPFSTLNRAVEMVVEQDGWGGVKAGKEGKNEEQASKPGGKSSSF